ncbi:MAG: energy-coupling factor transporter transmembrane component T [Thermoleophilaceae bacterium]
MKALIPVYRRRATPLHAARAGAAVTYCSALILVPILYENPLVLAGALAAVIAAGVAAGAGEDLRRVARYGIPFALVAVVLNPIVSQNGDTLLVRGGSFLGRSWDVTLEAVTYGAVMGLRLLVLILIFGVYSACVDPDEVLRLLRRVSYRSALTAVLATRLVPVLARDTERMRDAARCRPEPPGRARVLRASLAGALERAVDVAAALEVRGYAGGGRVRQVRAPWSRHDLRVLAAAVLVAGAAIAARVAGAGGYTAYETTHVDAGLPELALACGLVALVLVPFAGGRARLGVARA